MKLTKWIKRQNPRLLIAVRGRVTSHMKSGRPEVQANENKSAEQKISPCHFCFVKNFRIFLMNKRQEFPSIDRGSKSWSKWPVFW